MVQNKWFGAKGKAASGLRKRKYEVLRRYRLPANMLPGCLTQTYRRCGKPNCHCADGRGHPMWCLTYTVGGKKKVEPIPEAWVQQLQPMVDGGRELLSAVRALLTANAELLAMYRREQRAKRSK